MNSKAFKITGWIISGPIGAFLLMSAFFKLTAAPELVVIMSAYGLGDWITIIGIGEVAAVVLFLIPKTTSLGILVLSAYLGGAIVTHMSDGTPFMVPALLLVAAWIGAYLREPQVLGSLMPKKAA